MSYSLNDGGGCSPSVIYGFVLWALNLKERRRVAGFDIKRLGGGGAGYGPLEVSIVERIRNGHIRETSGSEEVCRKLWSSLLNWV